MRFLSPAAGSDVPCVTELSRECAGVSLRRIGERLGWDGWLFGTMEKGGTLGGPEVVEALDQY